MERLDEESFYGFIAKSTAFKRLGFRHREIFGQVGFGTGVGGIPIIPIVSWRFCGWWQPVPTMIISRVTGGIEQLPRRLWAHAPEQMVHWPAGTTLASLHGNTPRPGVVKIAPAPGHQISIT